MAAEPQDRVSAYALTPLAKADIFEIWSYIAADSVDAADRVEAAIYEACEFIAAGPLRGMFVRNLEALASVFWTLVPFPNYSIVYRPDVKPVQVIAVIQGRRDFRRLLRRRS